MFTRKLLTLAATVGMFVLAGSSGLAGTFPLIVGSGTYTVVEADAFLDGGSAGNTARITNPENYFAIQEKYTTQALWDYRDAGLNLSGTGNDDDPDSLEVLNAAWPPDLRTTLSAVCHRVLTMCSWST